MKDKPLSSTSMNIVMFIVLLMALLVSYVSIYLFMLLLVGLMPTLIVLIVDQQPNRYFAKVISSFNMVGLLPYIADSLFSFSSIDKVAAQFLISTNTWVQVYAAAMIGWLLYILLPVMYQLKIRYISSLRIKQCDRELQRIQEEWGLSTEDTD